MAIRNFLTMLFRPLSTSSLIFSIKRLLLILALIQAAVSGYAQTSLRPGYIVTTDTIRGAVVYREGALAIQVCSFKKEGVSSTSDYSPADIKGYGFESRHFIAVLYKGKPQFMEVIATGAIRLLRSQKAYYLVKDTTFALLEAEKKEKYIKGRRYEYEDKTWLGRVKPMLSDCQATAQALDGVQLSALSPQQLERRFSKVITQYNECHGEKTKVYNLPKTRSSISVGLFAGVTIPTAKFDYNRGGSDKYSGSSAPAFGLFFEWSNLRVSERFRFHAEVSYTKVEVDGTDQNDVERSVKYSSIKVPLLVHYSFSSGRITPFVRAGVALTAPFNAKYAINFPGVHYESADVEKFIMPLVLAGGLETTLSSKLRGYVEVRYELPSPVYSNRQLEQKVRVSQLAFQLGVRF